MEWKMDILLLLLGALYVWDGYRLLVVRSTWTDGGMDE